MRSSWFLYLFFLNLPTALPRTPLTHVNVSYSPCALKEQTLPPCWGCIMKYFRGDMKTAVTKHCTPTHSPESPQPFKKTNKQQKHSGYPPPEKKKRKNSCRFNLNKYFIFKVSGETCEIVEKQSTIYILYVGSQSRLCIFVHYIKCCYYLFSVQSVTRLLALIKLKPHCEWGGYCKF